MPAGNRTGPGGMGPRTGRGMGYCSGYDAPGWANSGPGQRFYGRGGRGTRGGQWGGYGPGGGGRGRRNWYYATGLPRWARGPGFSGPGAPPEQAYGAGYGAYSDAPYAAPPKEQEIEMLKGEAQWLKEQLDAINERMGELSQE